MKKLSLTLAVLLIYLPHQLFAAGQGVSSWTAQSEAIVAADLIPVTDISDTTQSDNGSSKKATMTQVGAFMATLFAPVDIAASDIPFTPNGSIAATNIQAAIQEVRDEAASGTTFSGTAEDIAIVDTAEEFVSTTVGGALRENKAAADEGINLTFDNGLNITNNGTGEETVTVNLSTSTGIIAGKVVTGTSAVSRALTEPEYHGGTVIATAASIYTLPTAAAGLSGCVRASQGVAAIIQLLPAAGDYIVKNGVRGTVATSIKSSGVLGDKICYTAMNADDWYVDYYGTWAE